MAQSGGGQGGEFTSGFGGSAEVHGRTASAAFDANDPLGSGVCIAAVETMLIFGEGKERLWSDQLQNVRALLLTNP
jgi:hypothetical protein